MAHWDAKGKEQSRQRLTDQQICKSKVCLLASWVKLHRVPLICFTEACELALCDSAVEAHGKRSVKTLLWLVVPSSLKTAGLAGLLKPFNPKHFAVVLFSLRMNCHSFCKVDKSVLYYGVMPRLWGDVWDDSKSYQWLTHSPSPPPRRRGRGKSH